MSIEKITLLGYQKILQELGLYGQIEQVNEKNNDKSNIVNEQRIPKHIHEYSEIYYIINLF